MTYGLGGRTRRKSTSNKSDVKQCDGAHIVSDMNSSFNPSAVGAIASCEGGKDKGEMELLCAESALWRCMGQVHQATFPKIFDFTLCHWRTPALFGVGVIT